MKVFFLTAMILLATGSNAQSLTEKFDSKGHPKAKGVWMSVKYPAGWRAVDGDRPNIVKKFIGQYQGLNTFLMIQIKASDVDLESDCKSTSAKDWEETLTDASAGVRASNAKRINHENKPAFIVDVDNFIERAGNEAYVTNRVMGICHKKNMVMAWCGTGGFGKISASQSKKNLELLTPLCFQYFNSVVLMDQYR